MILRFPAVALLLAALPLAAQDVSVGQPLWFSPEPAPDEMPKERGRLKPAFPDEVKATPDLGYVVVVRSIDESGKSVWLTATGTQVALQRAVEAEFEGWSLTAAKRAGKKVHTRIWLPIIFNPKSANPKAPDATPRLLAVTPVITATKPAGDLPVVRARIAIDATGAVTQVEPEGKVNSKHVEPVRTAVMQWRFAPARKSGVAVPAEVVMPVICQTAAKGDSRETRPARVVEKVAAEYPQAMKRFGLSGDVTIAFDVDANGKPLNFVITESDNPAFDVPALTALRQWKFQPALQNGQPIPSRHLPVTLHMNSSGGDAYQIGNQADQSTLPPEFRYDTPPKIRGALLPVYPYELRRSGAKGQARAAMMVGPAGRVIGVKILEASRPEFGHALAAALAGFRFDPAYRGGKPTGTIAGFVQVFDSFELPDSDASGLLKAEKEGRIVEASALDMAPKPIAKHEPSVLPDYPGGEATVECVVDKDGRVHLARATSATDEFTGYAAVQAATGWWFETPLAGGKPVVARLVIPFKIPAAATR